MQLYRTHWRSHCPISGWWKVIQTDSWVLLTQMCSSLGVFSLSEMTKFPFSSCIFSTQMWNRTFLQGLLTLFSDKWYLEAIIWALEVSMLWGWLVIASWPFQWKELWTFLREMLWVETEESWISNSGPLAVYLALLILCLVLFSTS